MRDVAELAGVSRQLVSIVLRGAAGASASSRARILAAAEELGYHPDDSARMLRRRRSGQIGVLFTMQQPFEVDLVNELQRRAEAHDYTLSLSTMSHDRSQRAALQQLMRQRIEALIALDAQDGAGVIEGLPRGIPSLLLGGPVSAERHDLVQVENDVGIALAIDHLTSLGHRRLAYVGPEHGPNAEGRIAAFRAETAGRRLSGRVIPSDYSEAGGFRAASELLAESPSDRPTALVCVNDHCAIGVLHTLVRAGVGIPEDISIVGFDDSTAAGLPYVRLTSVRPDPAHMAELAIETLRDRLADLQAPSLTRSVTPTLTIRGSTAPPRD